MGAAAAIVFFAYIGFDAVSTAAEEAKNPKRDVPIGIIGSLALCTILYIAVAAVLTGLIPSSQIDIHAPVAEALRMVGFKWGAAVIAIGAVAGITSVLVVMMLGQIRVFFAMSRDRLLGPWLSIVHPRFGTPHRATILTGVAVATLAALIPIGEAADMTNIGTFFAFRVGVHRRDRAALHQAGPSKTVSSPIYAGRPYSGNHGLPGTHVAAPAAHLDPVRGLDDHRDRRVSGLWLEAQQTGRRTCPAPRRDSDTTITSETISWIHRRADLKELRWLAKKESARRLLVHPAQQQLPEWESSERQVASEERASPV